MLLSYTLQYIFFLFNFLPYREKLRGDFKVAEYSFLVYRC